MTTTIEKNGTGEEVALIGLARIAEETLEVPIVGVSPLIVHAFSQKAKKQMLDATQGRKTPKEPKDPAAEYEAAFYRLADGGYGFPADAFKQATVGAARFYGKQLSMTALKQFIFFRGEPGADGHAGSFRTYPTPRTVCSNLGSKLESNFSRRRIM